MQQLVLDNIIYSLQQYGGISVYWNELIKRLYRDQIQFEQHSYPKRNKNNSPTFEHEIQHRTPAKLALLTPFKLKSDIPYTFHSSYYRYSSDKQAQTIVTVHDLIVEKFFHHAFKTLKLHPKRQSILHADQIICVSENTKNDLLNYYPVDESKVSVIYNGASEDFRPINKTKSRPKEILPNERNIMYVGARWFYKQFDLFTNVVNKLGTPYRACIVGGGALTNKEKQAFKNEPLHFEYIDNNILNTLYNHAEALLYPSKYEGFGIPLVEAAKAGCPILCFNNSCIPEVLGCEHPLFIEGKTREQHIESTINLIQMLSNQKNWHSKIIADQQELTKNLTWENTYLKTLKTYKLND